MASERANIPVEKKTRDILKRKKLRAQSKSGKDLTWDEFLLRLIKKR